MEIIYWLIPLTLIILAVAIKILFWAVKDGQFDDLESSAVSILFDDDINPTLKIEKDQSSERESL